MTFKKKQDKDIDRQYGEDEIALPVTEDNYHKVIYLSDELNDNYGNYHVYLAHILTLHKEVPNETRQNLTGKLEYLINVNQWRME